MHILVVENERKIADLLRQVLTEEGYQVVVAYDGREGLDLCRLPQFDLLVLDLMLPGTDGFEIARTLRAEGSRIPILILTARDSNEDIVKGLNTGADDYLTKPFAFDVLLARIRALSRRGPIASPVCHRIADPGERGIAEKFLQLLERHPAHDGPGCERVAQGVKARGLPETGVVHFEITASCAKRILAVRRALRHRLRIPPSVARGDARRAEYRRNVPQ